MEEKFSDLERKVSSILLFLCLTMGIVSGIVLKEFEPTGWLKFITLIALFLSSINIVIYLIYYTFIIAVFFIALTQVLVGSIRERKQLHEVSRDFTEFINRKKK